jgi:hypothetical protein
LELEKAAKHGAQHGVKIKTPWDSADGYVKPCWKNQPTLKLWRESGDPEKKRQNVPLEHPQGRQKKLCFQGGLGSRLGR